MGLLQEPDPSTLMPNQPGAGIVPAPAPQYQFAQPAPMAADPQPGGVHYGILSRLLGAKHAADVQDKQDMVKYLMDSIHTAYQNPDSVPDQQLLDWGTQITKLIGHPEVAKAIKTDIDRHIASKAAGKALGTVNATQAQGGTGTIGQGGTGTGTPAQPAAPAPINTSLFAPQVAGNPFQPQASPFAPQVAQPQQQKPQQPQQQQPPGMPPLPFDDGSQAGAPAPANIPAPMKLASDAGKAGYGVPPQPAPGPVNLATRYGFRTPEEQGVRIAARELPGLRQTNALALEHSGAIARQNTELQIAEAHRRIAEIKADPNWSKIPPNLQIEVIKQALGIPGGLSNVQRPLNLPSSKIHGPEVPEGALGIDGRPISRAPGTFYNQQQDIPTGEIRYIRTTPNMTTKPVLTSQGTVLVTTDHVGNIQKITDSVNGSPIVDPRLLASVHTTMGAHPVTSVDQDGKPVTVWVTTPSTTEVQKVMPNGGAFKPSAVPTPPGSAPAPRSGGAAPRASAATGPAINPNGLVLPKPDPAAIQGSAEYARSIQKKIPRIEELMKSLANTGDLGIIASRWNEFKRHMGGNPLGSSDPRYAELKANMDMFDTGLSVVHKTRGSKMTQHFQDMADAGKMDAPTLMGAFNELKGWVDHYAEMGRNRPGAIRTDGQAPPRNMTPPPAGAETQDQLYERLRKKHAGG